MILYQYLVIHTSFVIYVLIKVLCKIFEKHRSLMHDKKLKSIAEYNETEEEIVKWVPKKKHEVLKAKYKCLKKLFQIYDASVIGILPETALEDPIETHKSRRSHRRKRSYRTKSDAAAETSEQSSGDVTQSEQEATAASNVIKELKLNVSKPNIGKSKDDSTDDKGTQDIPDNVSIIIEKSCELTSNPQTIASGALQAQRNQKRKPTRFQAFMHRILGLNTDSLEYLQYDDKYFVSSDNNISNFNDRRRQRGLRLRRIKRVKKTHSEIVIGNTQSPIILSYVQTVQKSCLLDTTPRQCPFPGCRMVFNGIINYNDHLNLCHFPEKKFICNYCHDGFYTEHDKVVHENEHIGISKLSNITPTPAPPSTHQPSPLPPLQPNPIAPTEFREPTKITNTNNCQTEAEPGVPKIDVPDEKLKKIVSFFEKLNDPDEIIAEIKKSRISESNIKTKRSAGIKPSDSYFKKKATKCASSIICNNTKKKGVCKCDSTESDVTSLPTSTINCGTCSDNLYCRRKMSLHGDMEQRLRSKFQKYHSCVGILSQTSETEDQEPTNMPMTPVERLKSNTKELRREPSTNIIYFTSTESIAKKPSVIDSFVHRVRSGFSYKWEPGTKIIRV